MRWTNILRLICAAIVVCNGVATPAGLALQRRQASSETVAPTLSSNNGAVPTTVPTTSIPTDQSSDQTATNDDPTTITASGRESLSSTESSQEPATTSNSTSTAARSSTSPSTTPLFTPGNGTAAHDHQEKEQLPIKPRITPAFSIAGVILILTGVVYSLVGVKNKWVQISLSTAYLSALAVTVLIVYVMNPPISDGIQGAYFVGIFLTGLIFGAGALIFPDITEGIGCLLGGFCISMWFLTLKPGGLITGQTGTAIFIAIFCAIAWSLSFSHYTRAYGLIASTAFSGATALVLGIDCFARAGYKEFWIYIWSLNDDLFPLGTTTYPMTRGIRVEIVVVVFGTVIGVISQIKLWKIVKDKQKKKDEARQDEERRKDVVEQVIGRQLERQNDKDRSNWEKQYGNSLQSKRSTVLWSNAHPDQRYTHSPSLVERSLSSESLELGSYRGNRQSRLKRQSSATVDVIQEETEPRTFMEREKALTALQDASSKEGKNSTVEPASLTNTPPEVVPLPFKIPTAAEKPVLKSSSGVKLESTPHLQEPKRLSKRQSLQSMLSLSPSLNPEKLPTSDSQEALVLKEPIQSRTSSVAATLDEEYDLAELGRLADEGSDEPEDTNIVVSTNASPAAPLDRSDQTSAVEHRSADAPPSPPALSVSFDFDDPEELTRPFETTRDTPRDKGTLGAEIRDKRLSKETKSSSASDSGAKQSSGSYDNSNNLTGQTTPLEVLTKGLLEQVASQVSNVVMSYRTNEWAKHISTADAPVFDEPETIDSAADDAPTQIVLPSPVVEAPPPEQALDASKTLTASSKPPAPHVMSRCFSSEAAANMPAPQEMLSAQPVSTVNLNTARAGPVPAIRPVPKGKRSSSGMKQSLASTPIDENVPTEFVSAQASQRRRSVGTPKRVLSSSSLAGDSSRPVTTQSRQMYPLNRTISYASVDDHTLRRSRSSSMTSNAPGSRSETRLASYDSRQPHNKEGRNDSRKREQLLTDWRVSQQQGSSSNVIPKHVEDSRRAQMIFDKEQRRFMEGQERAMQQQKQSQIDQVMRRPDMQDLHRGAMRKMQASATEKL